MRGLHATDAGTILRPLEPERELGPDAAAEDAVALLAQPLARHDQNHPHVEGRRLLEKPRYRPFGRGQGHAVQVERRFRGASTARQRSVDVAVEGQWLRRRDLGLAPSRQRGRRSLLRPPGRGFGPFLGAGLCRPGAAARRAQASSPPLERQHVGHREPEQFDVLGHGVSCSLDGQVGSTQPTMASALPPPTPQSQPPQGQPDPELQTAVQYLRAGWLDRAEPLFRSAYGRYGDRPDVLHYLAVCLAQRGALAEAEALWRKALAKDPNEPMLSYNLGLMARRQGRPDEAARRFRDTIRRAPSHVEARLGLASLHIEQGRFAAAERELAEFAQNLDRAIQQPGGEGLKPLQARARNMLGHTLYRLGHYAPALEVLDMALVDAGEETARRSQIMGDRALALGGLGHHEEAIAEAERALTLAPENASLNHALGFVLYFAGRPSDAIPAIQKALELDPTFTQAAKTLALAQTAAGRIDAAIEILQRTLRHNPTDRDAVLQLSFLEIEQGRFTIALEVLEPLLKAAPNDLRALNNQGLALRGLKRSEEARRVLKRASRLAPDDPLVLTNLGSVLVDLDRAAEARSLHEHALRGLPGDPRLLTNYGICLAALGEKDKAREALDSALAVDPTNKDALGARTALQE